MALALDTDFRTALPAAGPETALKRTPENGSGGEEFAKKLERARDADLSPADVEVAGANLVQALPAVPPVIPDEIIQDAVSVPPAGLVSATSTIPTSAETALVTTAAISLPAESPAPAVIQTALPSGDPVDLAAPPADVEIPSAPMATAQTPLAPATQAPPIPAPAPAESSSKTSEAAPVTTEQPILTVTAAAITAPNTTRSADQSSRTLSIAQTGSAPSRPIGKLAADGPARLPSDVQAAPDAAATDTITAGSAAPADLAFTAALSAESGSSQGNAVNSVGLAAGSSPSIPASTASPLPVPMTPSHAVVVAAPVAVVDIVSQAAEDGQSDRIVVQLDPPELGRVSIDFKFDAQGLQHVTITSETPEAMRQLRMMHADLVQALERHGIAGQNMTFQHQHQDAQQGPQVNPFSRTTAYATPSDDDAASAIAAADLRQIARSLPGGRLDMRL